MRLPRRKKNIDQLLKPKNLSRSNQSNSQNPHIDAHNLDSWSRERDGPRDTDPDHQYLKETTISKNSSSFDVNKHRNSNYTKSFQSDPKQL